MSVRLVTISSIVWSMLPISSIVVKRMMTDTSLAGYPWFKCRARDTFISLPGLTLSIEENDYFELVMKTAMRGYYEFMEGKPLTAHIY